MFRRTVSRSAGTLLLTALLAALAVSPVAVAGHSSLGSAAAPMARTADLEPALASDGTFHGARGLAGTIDTAAWSLVSDLAAGEVPRFAHAATALSPATVTPIGPWAGVGSDGAGGGALNQAVQAIAVSGPDLYVGGWFTNAAGIPAADYIARWNGSSWSALGSNGAGIGALNNIVYALVVSGTDLYVGGNFNNAAGIPEADQVARWNGSTWSALGSNGTGVGAINGQVFALAASGTDLYVGGNFLNVAGNLAADYIAKWNGSSWSPLGSNGAGNGAFGAVVNAVAVAGADVYAGGNFLNAAGIQEADHVARWDGSAWHALGSNGSGDGALNNTNTISVTALAVAGSNVYVGGNFGNAANIPAADHVARWDGAAWHALGSGGPNGPADGAIVSAYGVILAMAGTDLYVGGYFRDVANIGAADYIARWDGHAWFALGSNGAGAGALCCNVYAIAGSGNNLYVGGPFTDAAGIATADWIARWSLIRKPDGRIQLGTGAFVGNNIYNTTAASQSRTGSATPGHSVTFGISIQNDGNASDRLKVKATGTAVSGYAVKYFRGTTDITAAVVAGTYQTPSLATGATYLITAKVTVTTGAAVGSSVTRLVTISSVANSAKKDAVKFTGKRA
jgi:hypothetical protein